MATGHGWELEQMFSSRCPSLSFNDGVCLNCFKKKKINDPVKWLRWKRTGGYLPDRCFTHTELSRYTNTGSSARLPGCD